MDIIGMVLVLIAYYLIGSMQDKRGFYVNIVGSLFLSYSGFSHGLVGIGILNILMIVVSVFGITGTTYDYQDKITDEVLYTIPNEDLPFEVISPSGDAECGAVQMKTVKEKRLVKSKGVRVSKHEEEGV